MAPDYLVTHSGGFHADEVLSTVILSRLFPAAKVVRTRAPEWLAPAADRIVYDVGGAYDADRAIFDHHQRGAPLREDGRPYSSFGLVWKHYGRDYLRSFGLPEDRHDRLHERFDASFVLPVDLMDNGAYDPDGTISDLLLPSLIESLKPVFDDTAPDADDLAFHRAVEIARAFVEAKMGRSAAKLRAEAVVMQGIADAGEGKVLELPMGMPFRPSVVKAGADHLLFVVHPRGKDWCITGIRREDEGFALRADLPVAWAGLTNGDLEAASGVEGALFCHNGRFIATAATREAILRMAAIAVAEAQTA